MRAEENQVRGGGTQRQGRPWYLLGTAHSATWLEHQMPTLGMCDGDDPEISFSLYSPASSTILLSTNYVLGTVLGVGHIGNKYHGPIRYGTLVQVS